MALTTIAIYGSRQHEAYAKPLADFLDFLHDQGVEIVMHRKLYDLLVQLMPQHLASVRRVVDDDNFRADVAISIGGDGTFLRTAMWVGSKEIPILGINAGHLGYLSGASIDELPTVASKLLNGDFSIENRSLLEVVEPALNTWPFALNEVAVAKEENASMIVADAYIGDTHLGAYKADGLLLSTPTGSTAYNLSVGGPIIQPSAPVWVLTPIAAHSLGMRPLVVDDYSTISVQVSGRAKTFRLSLDGRTASLPIGARVTLRKAKFHTKLIALPNHSFATALREKLHWNE